MSVSLSQEQAKCKAVGDFASNSEEILRTSIYRLAVIKVSLRLAARPVQGHRRSSWDTDHGSRGCTALSSAERRCLSDGTSQRWKSGCVVSACRNADS